MTRERLHDHLGRNAVIDEVALRNPLLDTFVRFGTRQHGALLFVVPARARELAGAFALTCSMRSRATPPTRRPRRLWLPRSGITGVVGFRDLTTERNASSSKSNTADRVVLVEDDRLGKREDVRVLERLVVALGHRKDHDLGVFSQVELRRAHEIAHVLDDDEIELVEIQGTDRTLDHVRLEVTRATRVDLHGRDAVCGYLLGIDLCSRYRPR